MSYILIAQLAINIINVGVKPTLFRGGYKPTAETECPFPIGAIDIRCVTL